LLQTAFETVGTLLGIQNKLIPTGNTSKEEGLVSMEEFAFKSWIKALFYMERNRKVF